MLLKKPILSEKTAQRMDQGLYVFEVSANSTKPSLKSELKLLFNVDAKSIRVVNLPAKVVNFRRHKGIRAARKHAYIQLIKDQRLPGFELPKEPKGKKEDKK